MVLGFIAVNNCMLTPTFLINILPSSPGQLNYVQTEDEQSGRIFFRNIYANLQSYTLSNPRLL